MVEWRTSLWAISGHVQRIGECPLSANSRDFGENSPILGGK